MIDIQRIGRPIFSRIVLGILAFLLTVSCGTNSTQSEDSVTPVNSDCRMIQHMMGETCVPLNPQRIVTIDPFSLENVLAFGLKPIGYAIAPDWLEKRNYLRDRLVGIESAGNHNQPSLEKILALKPDVILGLELESEAIYPHLAQIAPTVILPFETSAQWKDVLIKNAETLGQVDAANALMTDYETRLDGFKRQMQSTYPDPLQVSVVRLYPNSMAIYAEDSFIGTILEDVGLESSIPASQALRLNLSKETLHLADGDAIFVWSNEVGDSQQQVQAELESLKADPLWQQLDAVQNNRIYKVPSYWIGSSILTAHAVLDDLSNTLLETDE
ncbi:iron-siderophore ABC transporter substrate-binding protein [filamentous cyanobacterium CCP2]|nr:iron-siderophore ABC transporter substrate-binding protein [filamentous cyanobacterium CCP2]